MLKFVTRVWLYDLLCIAKFKIHSTYVGSTVCNLKIIKSHGNTEIFDFCSRYSIITVVLIVIQVPF